MGLRATSLARMIAVRCGCLQIGDAPEFLLDFILVVNPMRPEGQGIGDQRCLQHPGITFPEGESLSSGKCSHALI